MDKKLERFEVGEGCYVVSSVGRSYSGGAMAEVAADLARPSVPPQESTPTSRPPHVSVAPRRASST